MSRYDLIARAVYLIGAAAWLAVVAELVWL